MNRLVKPLIGILIFTIILVIAGFTSNSSVPKGPKYKEGELIVKFKKGVGVSKASSFHSVIGAKLKRRFHNFDIEHLELPKGMDVESAIAHYKKNPDVEYVEPNYIFKKSAIPNDPLYTSQWHHKKINSESAWDTTTGDSNVIISVLDTGVDYNHPDLKNNMWINKKESLGDANGDGCPGICGVDDDGDGKIDEDSNDLQPGECKYINNKLVCYSNDLKDDDDENCGEDINGCNYVNKYTSPMDDDTDGSGSHGTHVAGIIGSVGDNSLGVTGINWTVKLMAVKVLDKDGSGDVSDIVGGIDYAIKNGAKIINMSLEAPEGTPYIYSLKDAIISARDSNILVVCAAGNGGADHIGDNLNNINIYPASFKLENIIAVAATNSSDSLGYYSNYGTNVVHLAAPGSDIYSTQSRLAPGFKNYSTAYFYETGTSMASPMVAGVAGLLLSKNSGYGYKELKELILASVDKLNLPVITGGRLNAQRALTLDLTTLPPLKPENFSLAKPLTAGQPIELQWYDLSSVETGYRIERNLKNTGFSFLADLPANTAKYIDNTALLNEGDRVSYKLYAYNNNGNSDISQIDLQIPLNIPTQLSVTKVSDGIRLNWKDNTNNEDGYEIWRQSGLNNYQKIAVVGKDVTTYLDTNLANETFYYYKVRAYNNQGVYSDFSNEVFTEAPVINNSSSVSKCFIATSAYGTPFHPHIDVLRDFRDRVLMKFSVGRMFISAYYKYSPEIANVIKESFVLRVVCLMFIVPVVYFIKFPVFFIIAFFFLLYLYIFRKQRVISQS